MSSRRWSYRRLVFCALALASIIVGVTFLNRLRVAADSGDVATLLQLTILSITHSDPQVLTPRVSSMSIVGNYALTSYITGDGNGSGEAVFSKSSGSWRKIGGTGGAITVDDLTSLGIDATTANALMANLAPPPPTPTPTPTPLPTALLRSLTR